MEYKKAPDLAARRELCDQTRGRVRSLGGNQGRMNKQYSGQSWRLPRRALIRQIRSAVLTRDCCGKGRARALCNALERNH